MSRHNRERRRQAALDRIAAARSSPPNGCHRALFDAECRIQAAFVRGDHRSAHTVAEALKLYGALRITDDEVYWIKVASSEADAAFYERKYP